MGAQFMFLDRLFDAFDLDNSRSIDFQEFTKGLSAFMKGTPEEKMECKKRGVGMVFLCRFKSIIISNTTKYHSGFSILTTVDQLNPKS